MTRPRFHPGSASGYLPKIARLTAGLGITGSPARPPVDRNTPILRPKACRLPTGGGRLAAGFKMISGIRSCTPEDRKVPSASKTCGRGLRPRKNCIRGGKDKLQENTHE